MFTLLGLLACPWLMAQNVYQKPAPEILEILHAPVSPEVVLSPTREHFLLVERERYPGIEELARPMLGLAGMRINPANNGPQRTPLNTGLRLHGLGDVSGRRVQLPAGARIGMPVWSPDGSRFAFALYSDNEVEVWVGDTSSVAAKRVAGVSLNATYSPGFQWMPNGRQLLCRSVPAGRGAPPRAPVAPAGPNIQESFGLSAPARTHQDLLKTDHDDALFDYYFTSQMVLADVTSGGLTPVGGQGTYGTFDPSPDGKLFLVSKIKRPYSRLLTLPGFARDLEVWDTQGRRVHRVADQPSQEGVPIDGVPVGVRGCRWVATANATLFWVEALDGGNPRTKVAHRDKLMSHAAPFQAEPAELMRLEHRFSGVVWGEKDGLALISEYDRDRRWTRSFLLKTAQLKAEPRLVWERSVRDRYRDKGDPLFRTLPNGERVMWQSGNSIFLEGKGASPAGDFPFLDRFDLETLQSSRLFHCAPGDYEFVVGLVSATNQVEFITQHETPVSPPNYRLRRGPEVVALTQFQDPSPQLRKIKRELVTYKRSDGVPLSFTLYLPPDYQPGSRLPTVMWAYPLEYNDADTAGQVSGSTNRFTTLSGASHLFFLTQGYAVLDSATMPIVGPPDKMNDTFVEQIVASARAAIDKAASLGVTDPARVGVGGHSYGGFMTANLLAHSRLFRAGIARSGAYNRTLTPFGFQGERRTFWEAPETYFRMSPFTRAQEIKDPILLIHGEMDDNDGTFPIQSQRLFQAIKGNGGNVRYVTLPHEAHGYAARQSIEHVLYEMVSWFDQHVKRAAPLVDPGTSLP